MLTRLRKRYFFLLAPAVSAMFAATATRALNLADPVEPETVRILAPWLFVLAVFFAAAAPVMMRAVFAHRMRLRKSTPQPAFFRFQQQVLLVSLMAPYAAIGACLMEMPRIYQAGTLLAALYAAYYHFPTKRRLDFDRRIFRVGKTGDDADSQK
ncbi:MAG: hypothetical protein K9L59_08010 [Desulfobacterales bacterium]|nr:hypothetical protein [Desulfobacterales bacterium]